MVAGAPPPSASRPPPCLEHADGVRESRGGGVTDLSLAITRPRSSTNGRPTSNVGRESDYLRVPERRRRRLAGTVAVADVPRACTPMGGSSMDDTPEGSETEGHQMSSEAVWAVPSYLQVCDGVGVRFADNRADSDITVLLLAPWPETLWAFRRIWDRVSGVGRVVAIDMPGFGHSDGRPELIAPDSVPGPSDRRMGPRVSAPRRPGRRHGRGALPRGEDAGARHGLDRRRRRGALPNRSGRRTPGHHRSAES
jgi:hypothetical protein